MGGGRGSNGSAAGANGVREVGNVKLMARAVEGVETKDLKSLVDDGKKQIGSGRGRDRRPSPRTARPASLSASRPISPRASTRSDLVRKGSEALGGKGGGGRPDMAQAGGPDGAKAAAALSAIEKAMGSA